MRIRSIGAFLILGFFARAPGDDNHPGARIITGFYQ